MAIVGVGGLGCPAALYLAAAGVGTLSLIDADTVAVSNLPRQILYCASDVDQQKVHVAARRLEGATPCVRVNTYATYLTPSNAKEILASVDAVLDGSDNFPTKYLVNDACVELKIPFVSAAVFQFTGQISTYNVLEKNGERGPTLRCLFPEAPSADEAPPCAEVGVLNVVPGTLGVLQANEVIKLCSRVGEPLSGRVLLIDFLTGSQRTVSFKRNVARVATTRIRESYESSCVSETNGVYMSRVNEITPKELKARMDAGEDLILIDVREPHERELCHIGGELVPLATVLDNLGKIPKDKPVVIYCRSGGRSGKVIEALQAQAGYTNLLNLAGGILRWSDEVDSSVQKY